MRAVLRTISLAALIAAAQPALACDMHMKDYYGAAMREMHRYMMAAPYTGDSDVDFATGMIPHHQGAVDMARIVLREGKDEQVRAFARNVIWMQEREIGEMRRWLLVRGYISGLEWPYRGELLAKARDQKAASSVEYKAAMEKMHGGMHFKPSGDADYDFVVGMIPHHQGAVDMALVEMRHGSNPDMIALAQGIYSGQRQEIALMERWLAAREK